MADAAVLVTDQEVLAGLVEPIRVARDLPGDEHHVDAGPAHLQPVDHVQRGGELIERGIYEVAFRLFADEMRRARGPQLALGNRRLETCLDQRRREVESLAEELREEILARRSESAARPAEPPSPL